jgi:DNA-binding transcriptional MerR regulator
MAYTVKKELTVKKVAAMSGVSVRTLHFYDEMGLLKPARYGANGYRFYEEPQLLALQQILFYRELGLGLKQIQEILGRPGFETAAALRSHREVLQESMARTRRLIETIDKTLSHLKGTRKMKSDELFAGFSVAAGDDRFGEHIKLGGPNGEPIDCKVSSRDTGGAMCVFEFNCNSGGPRHLHYDPPGRWRSSSASSASTTATRQFMRRSESSASTNSLAPTAWTSSARPSAGKAAPAAATNRPDPQPPSAPSVAPRPLRRRSRTAFESVLRFVTCARRYVTAKAAGSAGGNTFPCSTLTTG